MATLIIRTNVAAPNTLIPDMGVIVPGAGGTLTFTDQDNISATGDSRDTRRLSTDDAYGVDSSTLILNDGTQDIPQADVPTFLGHFNQALDGELHADATYQVDGFMPFDDKHWANHGLDSGWVEGGELTYGGGLTIDVAAGQGAINDSTDETTGVDVIDWTAGSVTATANSLNWIVSSPLGVLSAVTTHPGIGNVIVLGTAFANATVVTMISQTRPASIQQHRGNQAEFLEEVFGGVATYGLLATPNITPLHLDVSGGNFFISGHKEKPGAHVDISWTYWYQDGAGGWTTVPGVSAVDTGFWDDGDGTLEALPTSRWKKDLLFICRNGAGFEFHLLYAQETYPTEIQAVAGLLPEPPQALREYTAQIAGIVVRGGGVAIADTTNEHLIFGQNNPSSTGTIIIQSSWSPLLSSSSMQVSNYGRQIVVPVASNGLTFLQVPLPKEAQILEHAYLIGIPSPAVAVAGPGRDIDLFTDYGQAGESPTTHQEADTTSTYDFTGQAGLITVIADLVGILTNAEGGDVIGLEVDHNNIGGAIEYIGVFIIYQVIA